MKQRVERSQQIAIVLEKMADQFERAANRPNMVTIPSFAIEMSRKLFTLSLDAKYLSLPLSEMSRTYLLDDRPHGQDQNDNACDCDECQAYDGAQ